MTFAFLIYTYFPYGGQQRDFLRVAMACRERGHKIIVYTMRWQGEIPEDFEVRIVPVRAWRRYKLYQRFTAAVRDALQTSPADLVIGFNKMPGLDVYFAADPCFAERALKERGFYYRFTARYRHFLAYERAVFGPAANTRILLLSPLQRLQFAHHYPGCESRMQDIPPGIGRDRMAPDNAVQIREELRAEFGLEAQDLLIVHIGSGFVVKGVDRSLRAIAALPTQIRSRVHYFIVGQDKPGRFLRLAKRLGIASQCHFIGGRDDVPRFLLGADLLLHPAYSESAGYVLLEATIAGLPVLTTDTCGYAFHIRAAGSGEICGSPFKQIELEQKLLHMLSTPGRNEWRENGIQYGRNTDLYSMPETVAAYIESYTKEIRAGETVCC
jgi:UDP-glucose:(heptosyl)LPS alpha-1,3-glucosyltransferase